MYQEKNSKKEEEDHQMCGVEIPETEDYCQEEGLYEHEDGSNIEQELPHNEHDLQVDKEKNDKGDNPQENEKFNNEHCTKPGRSCQTDTNDKAYQKMLEQKIRKQAQRLCELQKYITICEKRIKALSPGQSLPVPAIPVQGGMNKYLSSEIQLNSLLQSQKMQIQSLTTKLSSKESELATLMEKYHALQIRYNHLIESYTLPQTVLTKYSKGPNLNVDSFPPLDQLPADKIFETYGNLLQAFKQTFWEKEAAVDSLKKEIICNEEQRNYIEILKQTLENSLNKQGLFHGNGTLGTADIGLDIVHLKNEAERNREDLLKVEAMNSELKEELEYMTMANANMKEKIKESLDNGIKELEEAKEKVRTLELEKDYLSDCLNEAREYSNKLIKDLDEMIEKSANEGKRIEENEKIISELHHDQNLLENKLAEYKTSFEKITQELQAVAKEKRNLEAKFKELEVNYKSTEEEKKIIKTQLEASLASHKETEQKLAKANGKNEELTLNLNNTLKQLSETDKNLQKLTTDNEKLTKDLNVLQKELDEIKPISEKANIYENEHKQLKNENNKLESEKLQILLENDKLKIDSNEFSNNFNKILNQYENVNKNFKNLEKEYNALKKENENISQEMMMTKEKKETEGMNLMQSIKSLKNTITSLTREKADVTVNYTEQLENIQNEKNNLAVFMDCEIEKLKNEITKSELKAELAMKRNAEYEKIVNQQNHLEFELNEKEKYIRLLEDELQVTKVTMQNNNNLFENDYEILAHNLEQVSKELQSYKNDNRKLYDQNKKLQESNSKLFFYDQENKFFSHLLTRLTKFHLGGNINVKQLLQDLVSINDAILSLEFDRSKLEKKLSKLEKELNKIPSVNNKEAYSYENEINSLIASIRNIDIEINEKLEQMNAKDNEMKAYESESNNIFRGNYLDYDNTKEYLISKQLAMSKSITMNEGIPGEYINKETNENKRTKEITYK